MSFSAMASNDELIKGYKELTDGQEKLLALLPIPSAILSVFGSLAVVTMAFQSHRSKPWTPYHGLLTAMSICAILSAVVAALASFLYPTSSNHVFAFGNDASCTAVGFMNQFSTSSALLYHAALGIYFVLQTKYGLYNDEITAKYETSMHIVALGYPLFSSFLGLFLNAYGERQGSLGCWVRSCPVDSKGNRLECNLPTVDLFLGRIVFAFSFLSIFVCSVIIYLCVQKELKMKEERTRERNDKQVHSADWGDNSFDVSNRVDMVHDKRAKEAQMKAQHKTQLRIVRSQADLYIGGVMICNFASMTLRFVIEYSNEHSYNEEMQIPYDYFALMVIQAILFPLQGFVNMLVYMRPRFLQHRREFPDESRLWVFRRCIYGDQIQPIKGGAVNGEPHSTPIRFQGVTGGATLQSTASSVDTERRSTSASPQHRCKVGAKMEEEEASIVLMDESATDSASSEEQPTEKLSKGTSKKTKTRHLQLSSRTSSTAVRMDGSLASSVPTVMEDCM